MKTCYRPVLITKKQIDPSQVHDQNMPLYLTTSQKISLAIIPSLSRRCESFLSFTKQELPFFILEDFHVNLHHF